MNLQELKQKALQVKDKTVAMGKNAVEYSTHKLADSKLTLKTLEELEAFVQKSAPTKAKNPTTGEEKTYSHRVIIIFADTKSTFFSSLLYIFPVLSTKAFSQNISLKLADIHMKGLSDSIYAVSQWASLQVFENTKLIKTLSGEENIQKVVKSLSLDINTTIDSL